MCLGTIFKQTYPHFEVLAINDGSTEYSLKRLKEHAAQDARLQVFDQAQQGPAVARNIGLDHATGDYITFIDAADYVKENYLNGSLQNARRPPQKLQSVTTIGTKSRPTCCIPTG